MGNVGAVYEGHIGDQTVVLKTVPNGSEEFRRENAAYKYIGGLACVPRLLGVYAACPEEGWVGFLMQHVGKAIGFTSKWDVANVNKYVGVLLS